MKSYEALQKAIAGRTVDHAKRLGKSTVLLNKWQEPHTDFTDSGAYNPLDRLAAIISLSRELGIPQDDAFAPVYYLCEEFGLVAVPAPNGEEDLQGLTKQLHESIKEFGHLISAATEAMADGRISRREYGRIEREGHDLVRHAMAFIALAKESVR